MPQTRFVLKKALELGHRVVVVVNKVDRPAARVQHVINSTFELFCELNATDEQVGEGRRGEGRHGMKARRGAGVWAGAAEPSLTGEAEEV